MTEARARKILAELADSFGIKHFRGQIARVGLWSREFSPAEMKECCGPETEALR